jgi:N-acetyl sugar amidotransferase
LEISRTKIQNKERTNLTLKIERCKHCGFPINTKPGLVVKNGACGACLSYAQRSIIDWNRRKSEFAQLCNKYRKVDGTYDCLVAISGGKDSRAILEKVLAQGMHPLTVTVTDSFSHTKAGLHNLNQCLEHYKVNNYIYTINHDLFKRATRAAFEETGEHLKFVEYAIYTIPTQIAQAFDIGLVFYGENSSHEYNGQPDGYDATPSVKAMSDKALAEYETIWSKHNVNLEEVDNIRLLYNKPIPQVVYMSYFFPWDSPRNLEIAKRSGFKTLAHEYDRQGVYYDDDYEQIDSVAYHVHLWGKYPKFGFQRVTDVACRRVRQGLITKEDALKAIKDRDSILDQKALEDFCNTCGYTIKEFWDIQDKFFNPEIFHKDQFGRWALNE